MTGPADGRAAYRLRAAAGILRRTIIRNVPDGPDRQAALAHVAQALAAASMQAAGHPDAARVIGAAGGGQGDGEAADRAAHHP